MTSISEGVLPWHSKSLTAVSQTPEGKSKAGHDTALKEVKDDADESFKPFGDDGFSFFDLIDVVNPLHHIPVIGPMYREFSGDTIDPLPRITGSTLFFGPLGAGLSVADVVLEEATGKDAGAHMLAMLRGGDGTTQTAENAFSQSANKTTAQLGATGTDADDPVAAWARAELAFRDKLAADRGLPSRHASMTAPSAAGTDSADADPVTTWAQAEAAYQRSLSQPEQVAALPAAPPKMAQPRQAAVEPASVSPSRSASSDVAEARRLLKSLGVRETPAALAALTTDRPSVTDRAPSEINLAQQHAAAAYRATGSVKPKMAFAQSTANKSPAGVGAPAAAGGWFSEAMLGALNKHDRQALSSGSLRRSAVAVN